MKKVEQYVHANQFRIYGDGENCLQSYNSLVVKLDLNDNIILGRDWDYSTTTSKHVYMFLEEYTRLNFYNVTNKRKYVNNLIKSGKIQYNENMY